MTTTPLIDVANLTVVHRGRDGRRNVVAVDDATFTVRAGEIVGVVGESGSGKSTLARTLVGLHVPTDGTVRVNEVDLGALRGRARRELRRRVQMVFQDPLSSLNPRLTAGAAVSEPLRAMGMARHERRARVDELFELVGLSPAMTSRRPGALSGGQCQRVGIARALATGPDVLVADEAVSALDVSVQAQIINLLLDLNRRLGLTIVFVSHDISIVRHLCDRVLVLYAGRISESGEAGDVFDDPLHPYTTMLVSSIPVPDPGRRIDGPASSGRAATASAGPGPVDLTTGCAYRPRCDRADDPCHDERPGLRVLGQGRGVACHHAARNEEQPS
ncbi:MAG: ABC transporter ATP-binding protein [Actinomycetota bacterium]|nr:ABC transporter ATP-binding protein [Actinomycetota bacterium]